MMFPDSTRMWLKLFRIHWSNGNKVYLVNWEKTIALFLLAIRNFAIHNYRPGMVLLTEISNVQIVFLMIHSLQTGAVRLTEQGVKFTQAYTTFAVCTPTRYGNLTGRYNWRSTLKSGVTWGYSSPLIPRERLTKADMLLEKYITEGRSTPGILQKNDGPERWPQMDWMDL